MTTQPLKFEVWKARLREDCQRDDKLLAFNNLGEDCLRILWESGTEPSRQWSSGWREASSINYTRRSHSKAQVVGDGGDKHETRTILGGVLYGRCGFDE